MTNLDSILKRRNITLPTKVDLVKAMVFPLVMCGYESWTIKKVEHQIIDAFWTVMLEKTLESPLDSKEIQLVHPKGEYPWIFIGRTDVEAETLILWLPYENTWLIRKDPGAGKSANHHLNLSESVTIPSVITMKSSKDCKNSKNVTQSHELSKGSWKNGAFRLACH